MQSLLENRDRLYVDLPAVQREKPRKLETLIGIQKGFECYQMMEEALKRYYQHFKEDYPLMISGTKTEKEIIERINHCIEINQPESEPEYDENADY